MTYELPSWALVLIRTFMQTTITGAIAFVVGWLMSKGIVIDTETATVVENTLTVAAIAVAVGLIAGVLRWVERKLPWVSRLLSLFLTSAKPVYVEAADIPMAANAVDGLTAAKAA